MLGFGTEARQGLRIGDMLRAQQLDGHRPF